MYQRIGQAAYKADLENAYELDKFSGYPHKAYKAGNCFQNPNTLPKLDDKSIPMQPCIDMMLKRSASAPNFSIISSGSIMFPKDFDIFVPESSRTVP